MSKSQEKTPKKSTLRANNRQIEQPKKYAVGLFFPDRDLLSFEIEADEFEIHNGTAEFFRIRGDTHEFVGSFTHIAYIFIKDERKSKSSEAELPPNFGNIML